MTEIAKKIDACVRNVPDFPKPGVMFKDITPILQNAQVFKETIQTMAAQLKNENVRYVAGIESRGFVFASALALELGIGLVLLRKPGKLPWRTMKATYQLEYGTDAIEVHEDAVEKGDVITIVDDLLATGGTAAAAASLLREAGADVKKILFVIELDFLKGRAKLNDAGFAHVESLVHY
ncbi:MAG TPA: adenine phosphoribosyltransferase [Turneriella sp.]|nr:adenine phosphoribosyltransferase [Turneriella sp.]